MGESTASALIRAAALRPNRPNNRVSPRSGGWGPGGGFILRGRIEVPAVAAVDLRFERGTIRVDGDVSVPFVTRDGRSKTGRVPAHRYVDLIDSLEERGITYEDHLCPLPSLSLVTTYRLRSYQEEAIDAWTAANHRGVIELPTGSGKTVIGIAAIADRATPSLVIVPTIDLLEQWRRELETEFDVPIGQLGGGEQRLEDLTVATYDSAYLRAEDIGDRFGLVIFDEVHHLGGEGYRDIGRLLAAPDRLGLTATFERQDGAHEEVAELVGPVVYALDPDDLAGDHLAPYDIKRLEVSLTPRERDAYERHQEVFRAYLARTNLQLREPSDYRKLVMRSGNDPRAREALLARKRAREIMLSATEKLEALADILDRHRGDRVIVFTAHNDLVYDISERFLIPAITHQTGAEERRAVLDRFRRGEYSRVVTANVLDEGIDVPDANVAVVLSGSGSEREFTQRLGRILRPKGDGGRALLYEVVSTDTGEERIADRRR